MHQPNNHCGRFEAANSRREFLAKSAFGFGSIALGHLLARDGQAAGAVATDSNPLAVKQPHFPAKAKHVIFLFMQGGPSQLETFDPKPALDRLDGQPLPESYKTDGLMLQFMKVTDGRLMASPFKFQPRGQSGLPISDLYPHLAKHADDLAVIRSCYHDSFIHGPAMTLQQTGALLLGHPSVGSWVVYGLGSESDSLPAFITMTDGIFRNGNTTYGSGFLPAVYQGTVFRNDGAPVQNLSLPAELSAGQQRLLLDKLREFNQEHLQSRPGDSRLEARIANYELAFRMQSSTPDLVNIADEPAHVRALYGIDAEPTARFGSMCLLARRMVERGVRFVQLLSNDWDGHADCPGNHQTNAGRTDRPIAGLIADLKQRGLLESTLIVWTGEFGRTPVMQGGRGRDHSPYGFSSWMAGGGVKGGQAIGATDELGFRAVEEKVHVNDLHATMLHLLGLDHKRLTFRHLGRDFRLTDVAGEAVQKLIA